MVLPHLASASVHRLPSLYTCTTWTQGILLSKHLQSHKRGKYGLLVSTLKFTRSTTTRTSNSTIKFSIPSLKASFRLSLNAQNSADMLVAKPMDLANPLSHFPLQSLINPPPPALPGFPQEAPSKLSLNHPSGGLDHFTCIETLCLTFIIFPTQ